MCGIVGHVGSGRQSSLCAMKTKLAFFENTGFPGVVLKNT